MEERVRFELTPQGFAVLYINRFATVPLIGTGGRNRTLIKSFGDSCVTITLHR